MQKQYQMQQPKQYSLNWVKFYYDLPNVSKERERWKEWELGKSERVHIAQVPEIELNNHLHILFLFVIR